MLIVNNPSGNPIDIVSGGRRMSIKPKQSGQELAVNGDDAAMLKKRLRSAYPYLTFSNPKSEANAAPEVEAKDHAEAVDAVEAKAEAPAAPAVEAEPAKTEKPAEAKSAKKGS